MDDNDIHLFIRGFMIGGPISIGMWVVIIALVVWLV